MALVWHVCEVLALPLPLKLKGGRRAGRKEGRKGVSEPVWCMFVALAAQDAEAGGLPSLWSAWARAIKDQPGQCSETLL